MLNKSKQYKRNERIIMFVFLLMVIGGIQTVSASLSDDNNFTIAIIPDSQYESEFNPSLFINQTTWIVNNSANMNIAFVLHMGDIIDDGIVDAQWVNASNSMNYLNGNVSYLTIPGNHDFDSFFNGGVRSNFTLNNYSRYFNASRFSGYSWFLGNYSVGNYTSDVYGTFTANNQRYIVMGLGYCPTDADLNWANGIAQQNMNSTILLFTHSYLNPSGLRHTGDTLGNDLNCLLAGGNVGESIFQKLVRTNPNIRFVYAGNDGNFTARRVDYTDGFPIHQSYQDYQDILEKNYIRLYKFHQNTGLIEVNTYSPINGSYNISIENKFNLSYFSNPFVNDTTSLTNVSGNYIYNFSNTYNTSISSVILNIFPTVSKTNPYDINTSGLAGWWKFDDGTGLNVTDSSGNNINGTWNGNSKYNWTTGKYNYGGNISPDDLSYVSIPSNNLYNFTSKFSIEFWVYWNDSAPTDLYGNLVGKEPNATTYIPYYFRLWRNSGQLDFASYDGTSNPWIVNPITVLSPNRWYHVVGTFDSTLPSANAKLYINGVNQGCVGASVCNSPTPILTTTATLSIGKYTTHYSNATIDNVLLYNRTLNASEISEHYYNKISQLNVTLNTSSTPSLWNSLSDNPFSPALGTGYITNVSFLVPSHVTQSGVIIYDYVNNTLFNATINVSINNRNIYNSIINQVNLDRNVSYDRYYSRYNILPITVSPTSDNITLQVTAWNPSGDYHKSFMASSNIFNNPTTFSVGGLPINFPVKIKVDGIVRATGETNGSGYILFTYSSGFSSHQFEIDLTTQDAIALQNGWCNSGNSELNGAFLIGTILAFVVGAALLFVGLNSIDFKFMVSGVVVILGTIVALVLGNLITSRMLICG